MTTDEKLVAQGTSHGIRWMVIQRSLGGGFPPYYCGYVEVPFAMGWDEATELEVHGGITYLENRDPLTGEPTEHAWAGFDDMHSGVDAPRLSVDEAAGECERLCEQLSDIKERKDAAYICRQEIADRAMMDFLAALWLKSCKSLNCAPELIALALRKMMDATYKADPETGAHLAMDVMDKAQEILRDAITEKDKEGE